MCISEELIFETLLESGEGAILAAGAVVARYVGARTAVGGVPARLLKRI